jgi:hypothetical protein
MFSGRDLYPNMVSVMSTKDVTSPELAEQLVLTQGSDGQYPGVVTKKDRTHMLLAVVGIILVLFAFGLVK